MSEALDKIREYGKKHGLSDSDACKKLGISRSTLYSALRREKEKRGDLKPVRLIDASKTKNIGLLTRIENLEKAIQEIREILQ